MEYALNEIGQSLVPIVDQIYTWGRDHLAFYVEREQLESTHQM